MTPNKTKLTAFKRLIWKFYKQHGRSFDWRNVDDPYQIVVSEVMLQQTQTGRVQVKYPPFIQQFPGFKELARSSLRDVLAQWQGLGYNRRAKYLHESAKKIMDDYDGQLPADPDVLVTFPGIGPATAASICAFAFNLPTLFIETNIRSVFLHYFFPEQEKIPDSLVMPLVAATVDKDNPREWYYALMDYGVHLKSKISNPSRASAHHTIQSRFEGSDRQVRGLILKMLTEQHQLPQEYFIKHINRDRSKIEKILNDLCREGFIRQDKLLFSLVE